MLEGLARDKHLADHENLYITTVKSIIGFAPGSPLVRFLFSISIYFNYFSAPTTTSFARIRPIWTTPLYPEPDVRTTGSRPRRTGRSFRTTRRRSNVWRRTLCSSLTGETSTCLSRRRTPTPGSASLLRFKVELYSISMPVACTINIVTIVNYAGRGVICDRNS